MLQSLDNGDYFWGIIIVLYTEVIMIKLDPAVLGQVTKPARYTGQEWNSIKKDYTGIDVSFALAFPDVYEVGLSNLGFKILYHILNLRADTVAERTYAPWVDMEAVMRQKKYSALYAGKFSAGGRI